MRASFVKTVICLANSYKMSGRCFAGKEISGSCIGDWVRPVSRRPGGELNKVERCFINGREPGPLDLVTMTVFQRIPHGHQIENYPIDPGYYWVQRGRACVNDVAQALDHVRGPLWLNNSSSYNGYHDRVHEREASTLNGSLKLVEVFDLQISVAIEGAEFGRGRRRARANFSLNRALYRLSVTDPNWARSYLPCEEGHYDIGHAILCISLGEVYEGYAYKLVATVIPVEVD